MYNDYHENSYETDKEYGFLFLMFISPSFQTLIFTSSFITIHSYHKLFTKYSYNISIVGLMWLFLIINPFHLLHNISALRQSISIAFCIYSFLQVEKKNYTLFIFAVLLAAQFHLSAIIFLVILPLSLIIKNNDNYLNKYTHIGFLSLLMLLDFKGIVGFFLKIEYINTYELYLNSSSDGNNITLYINIILAICLIFSENSQKNIVFVKFMALMALYIGVIAVQMPMIQRLGLYFEIFVPVAIATLLNRPIIKNYLIVLVFLGAYSARFIRFNFLDELWAPFQHYKIFFL